MFEKILKKELFLFKLSTFFLLLIFLFLIVLQFTGCESTTQSTSNIADVKGSVCGVLNLPFPGIKVTAGNKSSYTDLNGNFVIPQVEFPYQLTILDTINKKCVYIPKRDDSPAGSLSIYYQAYPNNVNSTVNVLFPAGINTSGGKIIFRDLNGRNFITDALVTGGSLNINMAPGTQYSGSVYVILYTTDNNSHIVSYNKYCSRDGVIINPADVVTVNFLANDFKNNSRDTTYHVTLNPAQGQSVDSRYLSFNIGNRHTINYLNNISFEYFTSNNFDITVPLGLGMDFYPVVGFTSHESTANTASSIFSSVSGDNTITAPQPPTLISPNNNANISINTEIIFNEGLSHVDNKHYKLIIVDNAGGSSPHDGFEVLLDKERFMLSELENIGFGSLKGRTFSWYVEIYDNVSLNYSIFDGVPNLIKLETSSETRVFTVKQ
jgi:hypothetical protein